MESQDLSHLASIKTAALAHKVMDTPTFFLIHPGAVCKEGCICPPLPSETNNLGLRLMKVFSQCMKITNSVHSVLLESPSISTAVTLSHVCTFMPSYPIPIQHCHHPCCSHQRTECITVHSFNSFQFSLLYKYITHSEYLWVWFCLVLWMGLLTWWF